MARLCGSMALWLANRASYLCYKSVQIIRRFAKTVKKQPRRLAGNDCSGFSVLGRLFDVAING